MQGKMSRMIIGLTSLFLALLAAWRIGIWLEPDPSQQATNAALPSAPREAAFATGTVKEGLTFDIREVKVSENGKQVGGTGIVSYRINRDEVKAAALAMLKTIRQKIPNAMHVELVLKPHVSCRSCGIAEVSLVDGKGTIRYGIPSQAQIDASNALLGGGDDRPRLHPPEGKTVGIGISMLAAMEKQHPGSGSAAREQALEDAAASLGIQYPEAKRAVEFMRWYYTGSRYGSEEFTLD